MSSPICPPGPPGVCDFCFAPFGGVRNESRMYGLECEVHGRGEWVERPESQGEGQELAVCVACVTIVQSGAHYDPPSFVRCPVIAPLSDEEKVAVRLERVARGWPEPPR